MQKCPQQQMHKVWTIQIYMNLDKPYELVSSGTLAWPSPGLSTEAGWEWRMLHTFLTLIWHAESI